MRTTTNVGLTVWDLTSDSFNHTQMSGNWDAIDSYLVGFNTTTKLVRRIDTSATVPGSGTTGDLVRLTATNGGFAANTVLQYSGSAWRPLANEILSAVPTSGNYAGRTVLLSAADSGFLIWDLIRYNGSAWSRIGPLADLDVTTAKLADSAVTTTKLAAGAVTTTKIDSAVPLVPVGAVLDWPWNSASIPSWALLPYGQLLTAASYPAMQTLADAATRPYGGSAGTNFNMPDMRGRSGFGKDDMGGSAASRVTIALSGLNGAILGAVGGVEGVTLVTTQLPAHNHTTVSHSHTVNSHSHTVNSHGHTISGTPNINNGTLNTTQANHYHGYWNDGVAGPIGIDNGNFSGYFINTTFDLSSANLPIYRLSPNAFGTGIVEGSTAAISLTGSVTGDKGTLVADAASPGTSAVSPGTNAQAPNTDNTGGDRVHNNMPPAIIVNKIMRVL